MPDVQIAIGGRTFEVACQDGEQPFLESAAALLNIEASTLVEQIGRLPEARMLLMSGLMLADKTAGLEERLQAAEAELAKTRADLETLQAQPAPAPEKVEVPVIPQSVFDSMAEIAARTEALAETVAEKAQA